MSMWRPEAKIRVKALGLHWRDGKLLAAEVRADDGRVRGVRPLGGRIEFGEPADAALRREFKEELGIDIEVLSGPVVMESFYVHEGSPGHEVLFIFEVGLPLPSLDERDCITFHESDGSTNSARWYDLDLLDQVDAPELYPKGLKAFLVGATR